ncbi:MAG: hypothetical protein PVG78_08235 [Desulfobacterales bacterium]
MEIVFGLGASLFVFLLFFLVFAIRRRESDEPVRIHNCQNCNCSSKETGHLERFRMQAHRGRERPPMCQTDPDSKEERQSSLTKGR